jgi:hypothetical protein
MKQTTIYTLKLMIDEHDNPTLVSNFSNRKTIESLCQYIGNEINRELGDDYPPTELSPPELFALLTAKALVSFKQKEDAKIKDGIRTEPALFFQEDVPNLMSLCIDLFQRIPDLLLFQGRHYFSEFEVHTLAEMIRKQYRNLKP